MLSTSELSILISYNSRQIAQSHHLFRSTNPESVNAFAKRSIKKWVYDRVCDNETIDKVHTVLNLGAVPKGIDEFPKDETVVR